MALVGDSGGQGAPGLYFEIRYQGEAINPTKRCPPWRCPSGVRLPQLPRPNNTASFTTYPTKPASRRFFVCQGPPHLLAPMMKKLT